jgi:hypothetical protein
VHARAAIYSAQRAKRKLETRGATRPLFAAPQRRGCGHSDLAAELRGIPISRRRVRSDLAAARHSDLAAAGHSDLAAEMNASGSSAGDSSVSGTFECEVCAETSRGKPLECAHCHFASCGECAKRYWADRPFDPPSCMGCRKALSVTNLRESFSKTYVATGMENARRTALLTAEKGLFLQTQEVLFPVVRAYEAQLATVESLRLKLRSLELAHAAEQIRLSDLRHEYARTGSDKSCTACVEYFDGSCKVAAAEKAIGDTQRAMHAAADTAKTISKLLNDHSTADTAVAFARYNARLGGVSGGGAAAPLGGLGGSSAPLVAETPKEPKRVAPCTRAGCLGMYSSDCGTCMVCGAEHCAKCAKLLEPAPTAPGEAGEAGAFAVTGAAFSVTAAGGPSLAPLPHKCNADDIATAKYLATTTKPCPRCHSAIQRESGCSQMMCTSCHAIFDWNTLKEERGVVHNPHFYQLSADVRQRVVDERASRGIAAGREMRFLAGVGPRGGCDANAEHDPLCIGFTEPIFTRLLDRSLRDDPVLLRAALDLHRYAVHCAQVELPGIDAMLTDPKRFGEQRTRTMRLAYLNGGTPIPKLGEMAAEPVRFKSSTFVIINGEPKVTLDHLKRQLMRISTERTKLVSRSELFRTFAAAAEDTLRLALASTPGELKTLVRAAIELRKTLDDALKSLSGAGDKRARD